MTRIGVNKTYKLYIGGEFPRSESGRTVRGRGGERRPCLAQGRARRRPGRARRLCGLGGTDGLQPRPDPLPHGGDDGGAPRPARRPVRGRVRGRRCRSIAWSGTRAGPTRSRRRSARRTRWRGRTSTSPCRSRPASSGSSAPRSRRSRGSSRASRRRSSAATRSSRSPPSRARWRRSSSRRCSQPSDLPGGVVNILTGSKAELAPWLAGHMDVNAIDVGGADGQVEELERLAAENVKRVVRGDAGAAKPLGDRRPHGAEDGLAPDRRRIASPST